MWFSANTSAGKSPQSKEGQDLLIIPVEKVGRLFGVIKQFSTLILRQGVAI
jgi:hypothetical protein